MAAANTPAATPRSEPRSSASFSPRTGSSKAEDKLGMAEIRNSHLRPVARRCRADYPHAELECMGGQPDRTDNR